MSVNLTPSGLWLLSRVDAQCREAVDGLLETITEHMAIATADAVTIRQLSRDGQDLVPVAVHDVDQARAAAMASIMRQTQRANEGLWKPVVQNQMPLRWQIPPGTPLAEANDQQARFVQRFGIRAILAVPLLYRDEVVGGISLVRFAVDQPFADADENLVILCGQRIAPALAFRDHVT